jgi:hypothetical protein
MSSKPRGEKREKKSRDRKPKEPSLFADPDTYDTTVPPSLDQMVLVVHVPGAFAKAYTRGRQLGQGAFAHVLPVPI